MTAQESHLVDFTIPLGQWEGYLCPKDGKLHKDGTSFMYNQYCITCGARLVEKHT